MVKKEESRPTQEFVEIDSIREGVVILKNGSLRQILLVSGINFDLKSEEEQNLVISAYQGFLNALRYSVQIFVHSRRLNIEAYLEKLEERKAEEENELLQNQISEYIQFIKNFVGGNPIMTKAFFVVVPFDPIIMPGQASVTGKKFLGIFGRGGKSAGADEAREAKFREYKEQLSQRVAQVTSELSQVGLRAVPLQDEEITELFYNLYNPESVERKEMAQKK